MGPARVHTVCIYIYTCVHTDVYARVLAVKTLPLLLLSLAAGHPTAVFPPTSPFFFPIWKILIKRTLAVSQIYFRPRTFSPVVIYTLRIIYGSNYCSTITIMHVLDFIDRHNVVSGVFTDKRLFSSAPSRYFSTPFPQLRRAFYDDLFTIFSGR